MIRGIGERVFGGASGRVFRGMATLAAGAGAARLIGLASIPVLTRLYSPEDFGVLAVFTALVLLLVPLATLRYVVALPLPRGDGLAMNLLVLCLGLVLAVAAAAAVALWLGGSRVFAALSMEALAPWWWLVPLGVLAAAGYETLTMWATRRRSYGIISRTQVLQSALGEGLKIALGLLALKPFGLLLGQVVGHGGGTGSLLRHFRAEFARHRPRIRRGRLRAAAWRYRDFPVYRLPAQFLLVFSMQAPLLFAAALYDPATTGQLGLAIMAVSLPFALVGQAMSRAFFGELSHASRQRENLLELFDRTSRGLALIALPIMPVIFFFGEEIFTVVFGNDWRMAGRFAATLSLYLIPHMMASAMIRALDVASRAKTILAIYTQRALLSVAPFILAHGLSLPPQQAINVFAATMFAHYVIQFWITRRALILLSRRMNRGRQ